MRGFRRHVGRTFGQPYSLARRNQAKPDAGYPSSSFFPGAKADGRDAPPPRGAVNDFSIPSPAPRPPAAAFHRPLRLQRRHPLHRGHLGTCTDSYTDTLPRPLRLPRRRRCHTRRPGVPPRSTPNTPSGRVSHRLRPPVPAKSRSRSRTRRRRTSRSRVRAPGRVTLPAARGTRHTPVGRRSAPRSDRHCPRRRRLGLGRGRGGAASRPNRPAPRPSRPGRARQATESSTKVTASSSQESPSRTSRVPRSDWVRRGPRRRCRGRVPLPPPRRRRTTKTRGTEGRGPLNRAAGPQGARGVTLRSATSLNSHRGPASSRNTTSALRRSRSGSSADDREPPLRPEPPARNNRSDRRRSGSSYCPSPAPWPVWPRSCHLRSPSRYRSGTRLRCTLPVQAACASEGRASRSRRTGTSGRRNTRGCPPSGARTASCCSSSSSSSSSSPPSPPPPPSEAQAKSRTPGAQRREEAEPRPRRPRETRT